MLVYQFLSMNNELQTIRNIVSRNGKRGIHTIVDLEDSLEIPGAPEQTATSRVVAREKLKSLINMHEHPAIMGVRINHISGKDFELDIKCLQQLPIQLDNLVLPKVNSAAELQHYYDAVKNISYDELIVLLETVEGLQQLDEIMALAKSLGISKIHFGHWDYFLSNNSYPIPTQDCTIFWEVVAPLMHTLATAGFTYIHPPVNRLTDFQFLSAVINHIRLSGITNFGISTLTNGQSKHALTNTHTADPLTLVSAEPANKLSHALALIETFQSSQYSFCITDDQVFVAPHEYWAAKKYIAQCSNK